MFALVPFRDLATRPFAEVGWPDLVLRHGNYLVITCQMPLLGWPARGITHGRAIRYRVALYDTSHRRLAMFDGAQFPINDIAFHPTEPILVIATGEYDGGYLYEGELLEWNWETGVCLSLFDDRRDFLRCRFEDDGRITVLAHPPNDHDGGPEYFAGTFGLQGCAVAGLHGATPADLGFDLDHDREASARLRSELAIEHGAVIWDLAFTVDGRIAVARDDGCIELWTTAGVREHQIRIPGKVVQLLRQPSRLLAHVVNSRSELYALDGHRLERWTELPGHYSCSVDASGRLLARHAHAEVNRRDLVLTDSGKILIDSDLGHYSSFDHFLRIDGGEELFLLRGTPMTSYENKRLYVLEPGGNVFRPELTWDLGEHRTTSSAVLFDGDLVCSYTVHPRTGNEAFRSVIERRQRHDGATVWRHAARGSASALVAWPAARAIVAALVDGTLCILDGDGGVLHEEKLAIDGVPTIPTALAVHEETLVVGTIDGRLSLLSLR